MKCNKDVFRDDESMSKEDKAILKNLTSSYDTFRKDPIVRLLMTGSGKGGSTSVGEWRTWAENILGSSLSDVSLKDSEWVAAQTKSLQVSSRKAIFTNGGGLREYMIKAALLPADLFKYHGLGNIHEQISEADQIKAERRVKLLGRLGKLKNYVNEISNLSVAEGTKILREANKAVEVANANLELAKKGGDAAKIETARKAHEQALERFDATTGERQTANHSAKILRLIAERLNNDISDKQLRAKIGKSASYGTVKRIIDETRNLTKDFENLMQESSVKLEEMLRYQLEQRMPLEDAARLAKEITQFDAIDEYYPNRNLLALFQRVDGIAKAQELIYKDPGTQSFIDQINSLIDTQRTQHAKHRKTKSSLIDYNMFDVLDVYGKEVYDHAHAAQVGLIAARFEHRLMDLDVIKATAGKPNSKEQLYANSVRKLLMAQMNQMFQKKAATFADNSLATISAFQVFAKLTNPSTTINNRFEGVLQYISHHGVHRYKHVKQLQRHYKKEILEAMEEAHTDFAVEDITDPSWNPANNKEVAKMLAEHDLLDAAEIAKMNANGAIGNMRKWMSKIAGKGMSAVLWEKTENDNRKEAFMMGAAEGAEFIESKWKDRFLQGDIPQYLVENFQLDMNKVNAARNAKGDNIQPARLELYKHLRNRYIMRQGYRSMFQTQFQYSESARNFMDLNAKTSWITMFQHYPRSLASTIMWAMHDVKSLYDVGGLKALKGEITARKYGDSKEGLMTNIRDNLTVNHRLNHVLTLGGMSVLRHMIRMGTGFTMFNILSHPLAEIMQDLYSYFVDDEPTSKSDKAWELLYGRNQPIRRITGPLVSTALDVASVPAKEFLQAMDGVGMAAIEVGIRDGSLVQFLSDALGTVGVRPTEQALTDRGRKDYNSAMDVAKDYALHSFAMYGKGTRWVNALVSKNPHEITLESAKMIGIRPDWKVINQERDDRKAAEAREFQP